MSRTANGRKRILRGRGALGLFAAVWLNLALAPCAMAYEAADDHDCPHCPPAEMQGHHGMHGGAAAEMPCADGLEDCLIDEDVSLDSRGDELNVKDLPAPVALVSVDEFRMPATLERVAAATRYASVHPGAPPPLHLLNCVFLD